MDSPASNRQKKILRFFHVSFSENITHGAAGWEIARLMASEQNRQDWRRYLYVNKQFTRRIVELEPTESDALLGFLVDHAVQPNHCLRHTWSLGELCLWDERSTQHFATGERQVDVVISYDRTKTFGKPVQAENCIRHGEIGLARTPALCV